MSVLSVHLKHEFGGFGLDVAFEAEGGVTALFGRSGSGKTTVAHAVAGLFTPREGRIGLGDAVLLDRAKGVNLPSHQRQLGMVFQDGRLFPHLTVARNLAYCQRFRGRGTTTEAESIIRLLDLGGLLQRQPGHLSGGERQRVAIGRALLSGPRMLILDEPLSALDQGRRGEILPYLERLRDQGGMPMLYISHALDEVVRLADAMVVLEAGKLRASGPLAQLLADPDLAPVVGLRQAGAVVEARLMTQHADGLTEVEVAGAGRLLLPRVEGEAGQRLRLRLGAQDVILSRNRPEGLSALNILPVTVVRLRWGEGPGVLVQLQLGESLILCRLTARSAKALELAPGMACHAILKSLAVTA